jgi:hypothetical protein
MERMRFYLLIALVMIVSGCRVLKRKEKLHDSLSESRELLIRSNERISTEYFSDNLIGRIPLPPLSKIPVVIPVESQGISLEITLTEGELSWKAKAKAVSKTVKETETDTDVRQYAQRQKIQEDESNRRSVGLPWWMYLVLALALVIVAGRVVKKINFPF